MRTLLACAACVALAGCATGLMRADDASTVAVRSAFAAQVMNPAGASAAPVSGLGGRAASQANERYEKSFGAKESGKTYSPDMGTEK